MHTAHLEKVSLPGQADQSYSSSSGPLLGSQEVLQIPEAHLASHGD